MFHRFCGLDNVLIFYSNMIMEKSLFFFSSCTIVSDVMSLCSMMSPQPDSEYQPGQLLGSPSLAPRLTPRYLLSHRPFFPRTCTYTSKAQIYIQFQKPCESLRVVLRTASGAGKPHWRDSHRHKAALRHVSTAFPIPETN